MPLPLKPHSLMGAIAKAQRASLRRSFQFRHARSHHENVAQRSGRTKLFPALILPRLAPDPFGEDLERDLCLDIRPWPNISNLSHVAGKKPEYWPPRFNCPRCRQLQRPTLYRLDARERFGVGTKRSRGEWRGVHQARPIALGHAHRGPAPRASADPQGLVPSGNEWPPTLASLSRRATIRVRSNRRGLSCFSHRSSHVVGLIIGENALSNFWPRMSAFGH